MEALQAYTAGPAALPPPCTPVGPCTQPGLLTPDGRVCLGSQPRRCLSYDCTCPLLASSLRPVWRAPSVQEHAQGTDFVNSSPVLCGARKGQLSAQCPPHRQTACGLCGGCSCQHWAPGPLPGQDRQPPRKVHWKRPDSSAGSSGSPAPSVMCCDV